MHTYEEFVGHVLPTAQYELYPVSQVTMRRNTARRVRRLAI